MADSLAEAAWAEYKTHGLNIAVDGPQGFRPQLTKSLMLELTYYQYLKSIH